MISKKNNIKVDIVIPVYNGKNYVSQAIQSVLNQTYKINNIIVVNDGSTDSSHEILDDLSKKHESILYFKRPKQGVSAARNFGVSQSTADYIAFLDCDDLWHPEKIKLQILKFENSNNTGVVYCNYNNIDKNGDPYRNKKVFKAKMRGDIFDDLIAGGCVTGSASAVLVKKDVLNKTQLFDPKLSHAEDYDVWLQLAKVTNFDYCSENLVSIRLHSESSQQKANSLISINDIIQRQYVLQKWPEHKSKTELTLIRQQVAIQLLKHIFKPDCFMRILNELKRYNINLFNNKFHLLMCFIDVILRYLYWKLRCKLT